jgi:hypothetical protein
MENEPVLKGLQPGTENCFGTCILCAVRVPVACRGYIVTGVHFEFFSFMKLKINWRV